MKTTWVAMVRGALVVALLGAVGCGDSGTPTAPTPTDQAPTSVAVLAMMETGIQDEYKAEQTYLRVVADFGAVTPFQNILFAEQRHSAAIAQLYSSRSLATPESGWNADNVPRFETLGSACGAAVQAELENIAMYDGFLALELPADVRQVFENNRAASLQNHLPAFERCRG